MFPACSGRALQDSRVPLKRLLAFAVRGVEFRALQRRPSRHASAKRALKNTRIGQSTVTILGHTQAAGSWRLERLKLRSPEIDAENGGWSSITMENVVSFWFAAP